MFFVQKSLMLAFLLVCCPCPCGLHGLVWQLMICPPVHRLQMHSCAFCLLAFCHGGLLAACVWPAFSLNGCMQVNLDLNRCHCRGVGTP